MHAGLVQLGGVRVAKVAKAALEFPSLSEDGLDVVFASQVNALWSYYSAQVLGSVRASQERGLARILGTAIAAGSSPKRSGPVALPASTAYERLKVFLARQNSAGILGSEKVFTKRYEANPTLQNIARGIDSIEDEIEAAMVSRDRLEALVTLLFSGHKKVRFKDESIDILTSSGGTIGLGCLSSGEKHLLLIFVHCLLAEESSLIIDEPELSMHVDWQRRLIESMRTLNPRTQLILAAHSPEIMADVPDDKIFRL